MSRVRADRIRSCRMARDTAREDGKKTYDPGAAGRCAAGHQERSVETNRCYVCNSAAAKRQGQRRREAAQAMREARLSAPAAPVPDCAETCLFCFSSSAVSFDFRCIECGVRFMATHRARPAAMAQALADWSPTYKRAIIERLEAA